ncbi:restriction endonuclease subunit S [Vibrio sp. MA40-2]|uniref:restriction endonuclease subunit S n=1 Tax=Vibrio sp. MA40-2 TaxID=3391828 RepID=UPI0039A684FA
MTEQMNVPKLRFSEFSIAWKLMTLGDITSKVGSGATPRGGEKAYVESGIPFIRSQNVNNNRLLLDKICHISEDTHASMKRSKIEPEDILLNITGASIGRSCVVPEHFQDGNLNQHVCIIRLKNDDPYFTQSILSSYQGKKLVFQGMAGGGREGLNFESIKGFKMAFPQLPEQQKIASFLSKVDEKIGLLSEKKDKLTEYKRGVMQQLFNGKWHEQDGQLTFVPPTLRFKADDGSEFPDWEEVQLGSLTSVMQSGISRQLSSDDIGYPILRSNNLYKGKVSFEDIKYWHLNDDQGADLTRYVLSDGDVLVNFINSLSQIGKVAIYQDLYGRDVIYTTNIMRLKFKASMISKFAFYSFNTVRYVNFIQSIAKPAVSQASFTTVDFKKYKMHLPVLAEQEKIISFLSALDQKIDLANSELKKAKEWKKGLLQQMFV